MQRQWHQLDHIQKPFAPQSRQTTMPAPNISRFCVSSLPANQSTAGNTLYVVTLNLHSTTTRRSNYMGLFAWSIFPWKVNNSCSSNLRSFERQCWYFQSELMTQVFRLHKPTALKRWTVKRQRTCLPNLRIVRNFLAFSDRSILCCFDSKFSRTCLL